MPSAFTPRGPYPHSTASSQPNGAGDIDTRGAAEAKTFVLSLKERYGYEKPVDCSDDWTEEDSKDAQIASLRRLDQEDPVEGDYD